MQSTDTVIIGAGQAGLALSHCLAATRHDHVIIERGQVGERWRSTPWDSLRLLTPNWMTRLPGWTYDGPDPDGFMTAREVGTFFHHYATSFAAPVHEQSTVHRVTAGSHGFTVRTNSDEFRSRNVVIATGWCDQPAVPSFAADLPTRIHQVTPDAYRDADSLPSGGVLVVGASATGVQLADEIRQSGRDVTLAVGGHSRIPRRYRGMDIFWWLDRIGSFDKSIRDVGNVREARAEPSLQLVGRSDHTSIDLGTLHARGVRVVGRLQGINGSRVGFGDDLVAITAAADRQMDSVLDRVDDYISRNGLSTEVDDRERIERFVPSNDVASLDLDAAGIGTVVWATGYRRPYGWLNLPIRDHRGEILQYRGVTPFPGAYVLGQRFQHFRNSNFIDGVGRDACYVADHICNRSRQGTASTTTHVHPRPRKRASSCL